MLNQSIQVAAEYLSESEFKHHMEEASKDDAFNERMMDTMTAFEYTDNLIEEDITQRR